MNGEPYWFVDAADGDSEPSTGPYWQVFLQDHDHAVPLQVWFSTVAGAERFMATIPSGRPAAAPLEPPGATPAECAHDWVFFNASGVWECGSCPAAAPLEPGGES